MVYMLARSANRRTGMIMATKIMIPPIVGVPFFCICPSSPRSRMVSPICFFWSQPIIFFPAKIEMRRAVVNAAMALKDRYWKSPDPGRSVPISLRYSKIWYIIVSCFNSFH